MKSLIKLGLILGVIALVYYRFYGDDQEKEQSKKIINTGTDVVKDLGKLTWNLLKKGKQSLDEGDYDETIDHISGVIDDLKEKAGKLENAKEIYDKISDLEQKRNELQKELAASQVQSYGSAESSAQAQEAAPTDVKDDLSRLLEDTENLAKQMEGN